MAWLDQGRAATDPVRRHASFESALEECRRGLERGVDVSYYSNAAKVYDLMAGDDPAQRQHFLELALAETRRGVEFVEHTDPHLHTNQRLPEIYEACGVILSELGRAAEAVPCFERLVSLDATSATRWGMLAEALMQSGRTSDALAPLHTALRLEPERGTIWLTLGDAELQLGHSAPALEAYRRVLLLRRGASSSGGATPADAAAAQAAIDQVTGHY